MTVLTKNEILKEIAKGRIKITPFNKKNIGPASIDLTIDNKFRVFKEVDKFLVNEKSDYKKITQLKKVRDSFILKPGELALGITKERIKLPSDICGWLSGRSRFARIGLLVHITANFVQPGINNKQVLEIRNVSPTNLIIKPGTRICQIILEKTQGKAEYKGKFKQQQL